jgi:O-antigen ligase
MTVSRGGFVGVIVGAVIGAVFLRQYISARVAIFSVGAIAFIAIAGVGILVAAGYGDVLYERTIGLSTESNTFDVSSGRNFIWSTALNKMFEQPVSLVTGYGWDTYRQFRVFRFAPHNTYLKLFFELGAIGLLLILIAFANVFRTARQGLKNAESEAFATLLAFIFGLISILVAIFFVDIQSPWLFVWAYVGSAMRLAVSQRSSVVLKAENNSIRQNVRRYAPGGAGEV